MKRHTYHLKVHDRYQVELKFDYPIARERKREEIEVETYFFVPSALDVNAATYKKDDFYQDLQTYTRYGTPIIALAELLNPANDRSPLARIRHMKPGLATGKHGYGVAERAEYELRILACIFRGETRERGRLAAEFLAKARPNPKDYQDAAYLSVSLLDEAAAVLKALRDLHRACLNPYLPENVERAFRYMDEAMSVQLESVCGKVYRAFARNAADAPPEALDAANRLAAAMSGEEEYRRKAGYPTLVDASNGPEAARKNEYFLYRAGVLKKYFQSTLFLSVQTQQGSRSIVSTISAIAAMAGMAFFIMVLWFLDGVAPADSLPYMLLVVIVYAFRESIKENLRGFLSQRMTRALRDRERRLIDRGPTRTQVGRASEAFSFLPLERVPEAVRNLRDPDDLADLAEDGLPESVVKFQKHITLYSDRVFGIHKRVTSLNEILRFNVRRLLLRMDDPRKGLTIIESMETEPWQALEGGGSRAPQTAGEITNDARSVGLPRPAAQTNLLRVGATKVYHVNLILRVRSRGEKGRWTEELEKFRLVLSRDGIERVEANGTGHLDDSIALPSGSASLNASPSGIRPAVSADRA
ncbi:MAG: hypothetical protein KIS92_12920 [Planctomycetota bacterium]|nr:hypothetical protein [Planctomycetota bacterium]